MPRNPRCVCNTAAPSRQLSGGGGGGGGPTPENPAGLASAHAPLAPPSAPPCCLPLQESPVSLQDICPWLVTLDTGQGGAAPTAPTAPTAPISAVVTVTASGDAGVATPAAAQPPSRRSAAAPASRDWWPTWPLAPGATSPRGQPCRRHGGTAATPCPASLPLSQTRLAPSSQRPSEHWNTADGLEDSFDYQSPPRPVPLAATTAASAAAAAAAAANGTAARRSSDNHQQAAPGTPLFAINACLHSGGPGVQVCAALCAAIDVFLVACRAAAVLWALACTCCRLTILALLCGAAAVQARRAASQMALPHPPPRTNSRSRRRKIRSWQL